MRADPPTCYKRVVAHRGGRLRNLATRTRVLLATLFLASLATIAIGALMLSTSSPSTTASPGNIVQRLHNRFATSQSLTKNQSDAIKHAKSVPSLCSAIAGIDPDPNDPEESSLYEVLHGDTCQSVSDRSNDETVTTTPVDPGTVPLLTPSSTEKSNNAAAWITGITGFVGLLVSSGVTVYVSRRRPAPLAT